MHNLQFHQFCPQYAVDYNLIASAHVSSCQLALARISSRQLASDRVGSRLLVSACVGPRRLTSARVSYQDQISSLNVVFALLTNLFHEVIRCRPSVQIHSDFLFSEYYELFYTILWFILFYYIYANFKN